jgi:hypothetical protein
MTQDNRDRARIVQDRVANHPKTKKFIEEMGEDYPLFGEGTPTYLDIKLNIFPGLIDRMERFLGNEN